ncbi:MAG: glycoside hydrolase family 95 protein, partial [Lachnospiraceae bacterium]|nr:glycoside hydrolase family 95 protein [Lachnospiraceae bacterium]
QINESTVWSGGPGANPNYDGGSNSYSTEEVHEALQNVRQTLQNMVNDFAENKAAYKDANGKIVANDFPDLTNDSSFMDNLNKLKGVKNNFGTYQSLGDIEISDLDNSDDYSGYLRTSNISEAIQTVTYEKNGVNYKREYFINNPSNVLVCKLSADQSGSISKIISVRTDHSKKSIYVDEGSSSIVMEGQPNDQSTNGLRFAQVLKVINEGGTLLAEGNNGIKVEGADSVVIIMSAGTNYKSDTSTEYNYFEDEDPISKVDETVTKAVEKGYDSLLEEHVRDYTNLFDRCTINIGANEIPDKMTDDLLADYNDSNSEEEDRYLETLFFQYGRYLLISCSRENSKLPANLQGIWAEGLSPMWNSDYHTNINLQMNYWLAEQTGLSECHTVVLDYINDMVEKGKETAQKYYCKQDGSDVRGWVIHHENNIWGNTNPSDWTTAFYFPAAAAWQCQDMWEAYQFTCNKSLLEKYYDTMVQAALFWVDNLWVDERDESLVANPSYSPEHGTFNVGCISDQAIIWELFDEVCKAAKILGRENDSDIREIVAAKEKLYMPKADTLGGQFREWKDETSLEINNSDNHRHQNQLYVLHPGTYVVCGRSEEDDALAEAARITLEKRGDGGTGWSKAWKINMWARLRDGNRAKKLLSEQLDESTTLKNLFDTHPPFQIDGNFGATSGVAEMLLQSQGDYIEPLAALPDDWYDGSYKGLKARGNFDVSAEWSDNVAKDIVIKSGSGNVCAIKYTDLSAYNVVDMTAHKKVTPTVIDANTISFPTVAGSVYKITTASIAEYIKDEPVATVAPNSTLIPQNSNVSEETVKDNKVSAPAVPKLKSVKAIGGKKIRVIISKRVKKADGYVIRYSLKKSMKASKKVVIKSPKTLKKVIKGLKKGKKYYVQVQSYKKTPDKKVYSKWCKKMKVKVK